MRSHLEFRSPSLIESDAGTQPEGQAVAQLIAEALPAFGFNVTGSFAEDWGWRIDVEHREFPLWIGCGRYREYTDGMLCFIEPSRPYIRNWLKRIATSETVEQLASALGQVLIASGKAAQLRWWTEDEVAGR